jgi:rfaE bifunctional protein kinase chain/domain
MKNVVLIGDVMLDVAITGVVSRVAPEAPIGIISELSREENLGGAGNVYNNLVGTGITPYFITIVGNDDAGVKIYNKIDVNIKRRNPCRILVDDNRPTTTKTRVYAYTHHIHKEVLITRIDKEITAPFLRINEFLNDEARIYLETADFIVFSDYSKGVITKELVDLIREINPNAKYVADYKKFNECYKNFDIVMPNEMDVVFHSDEIMVKDALKVYKSLYGIKCPIITRGEKGVMFLDENENVNEVKASDDITIDVTGAGDTFMAYLVASLCEESNITSAVQLATKAAGISVSHEGIYTVKMEEVRGK